MGEKIDIYRSYGEKLISLFARLLFSGESYSLTELARMLNCSKQTVLRLMEDIRKAYGVDVEESYSSNKKYFRLKRPGAAKSPYPLSELELSVLRMCRDFTSHLLGKKLFEEATRAIGKTQVLLPQGPHGDGNHFGVFRPGTIDYTPYHDSICTLLTAMDEGKVCRLTYKAIMESRSKTFHIKPLKLFSKDDTIYLLAQLAKEPGMPYREPDYDPLLAVHRIRKVEITDRRFDPPQNYDFEKIYNKHFGVIKDDAFEVEVEFCGWAARYVSERTFSPDQKIRKMSGDKIRVSFAASSEPEVIAWVLSFGAQALLLRPDDLKKNITRNVRIMHKCYGE
jgi:predicted DNA-binding transcriptional regulator YafY